MLKKYNNSCNFREETSSFAGRFSKSPSERERMLHKRKEHMVQLARKRYIEKRKTATFHQEKAES